MPMPPTPSPTMHPPLAMDGGEARWILLISAKTTMVADRRGAAVLVGLCDAAVASLQTEVAIERIT